MSSRGDTAKAHSSRGTGSGSRLPLSVDELEKLGWKIERSGKGFKWTNPTGKAFYSSSAVKEHLAANTTSTVETSDSDYGPMEASSDDCFSSPEKAQLPYGAYQSQKGIVDIEAVDLA